jgi:hypothetical protein
LPKKRNIQKPEECRDCHQTQSSYRRRKSGFRRCRHATHGLRSPIPYRAGLRRTFACSPLGLNIIESGHGWGAAHLPGDLRLCMLSNCSPFLRPNRVPERGLRGAAPLVPGRRPMPSSPELGALCTAGSCSDDGGEGMSPWVDELWNSTEWRIFSGTGD